MNSSMAVGVDIAKQVFQVHYVHPETGEIVNKPIKRALFLEHFANRAPCLIGMEACGGAHHWARHLLKMGHEVKLIPAEFAKAFNIRNKSDAADARAIWLAVQQPGKPVAVKTETQQAMLALHRMRQQLIKFRTMQVNNLRGLLTEYGALGLLDPQAQHFLATVGADAQRQIDCLVPDRAFVADLQAQRVKVHDRIHGLERALLPLLDLGQHLVGDRGNQIGRHLQPVQLQQMALNLATLMPRAYMLMT